MRFWTTLIRVIDASTAQAIQSLKENCTHVTGGYWIMEGDVDCLRDDGVVLHEVAEGAVGALGDLTEAELIKVCLDCYGYTIPKK